MIQVFHHYSAWEDANAGMWRSVSGVERELMVEKAVEFTGNTSLYGSWMMKVILEWPVACEQNFTNQSMNHQAWVGHAAVCLATGIPEDITREAWWKLSEQQRDEANARADEAIRAWKTNYMRKAKCQNGQLELMY